VPLVGLIRTRRIGLLARLTELQKQFGDLAFFRIAGQSFCLCTDPELIRRIVVTDAGRFTKSHALSGAKRVLGEGLLTSGGDLHRTQRRMIQPVFHAQQVKAYAADFVRQAKAMRGAWRDGETIDLHHAMTELTLRVVAKSLFDAELDADVGPIGEDMAVLVEMFERSRNPLRFLLDRLPLRSNRRFFAALDRLDARIRDLIRARQENPDAERFDLLSLLLMAHGEHGTAMSEQQARDEAVTLFMAGHETTANALVWTWLFLAEHADVAAKLHAELDEVLGDRDATADDVPRLKYVRAVLSESMRLRPPAWIIARECVDAYDLGSYRVPAHTTILMPQYLVHRDPRWWPDAETFRPERWLEPDPSRPKYAYYPFGGGPRSCVGEPFAWLEAILLLATLAQRWRLERVDAAEVKLFPTITLRPRGTVGMRVAERCASAGTVR
jgi:cytochrome P450